MGHSPSGARVSAPVPEVLRLPTAPPGTAMSGADKGTAANTPERRMPAPRPRP